MFKQRFLAVTLPTNISVLSMFTMAWAGWATSQKKLDTQTMTHWTLLAALSPHIFSNASVHKVVCQLMAWKIWLVGTED
jgi:aryl-phospho-beta-D-glucosidase BglC (GH1 family)